MSARPRIKEAEAAHACKAKNQSRKQVKFLFLFFGEEEKGR
jgi:hypothetical protein